MLIEDLKGKLHSLIETTKNEALLEDLLLEAESRVYAKNGYEAEGLSQEDFEELTSLVNESPEKDLVSLDELKFSLSRWFIK
ncbi:MAG TPA: hypothetical protein VF623_08220 [Segetibacter sp.]